MSRFGKWRQQRLARRIAELGRDTTQASGYRCEPCGWECAVGNPDDLAMNVDAHLASELHRTQGEVS